MQQKYRSKAIRGLADQLKRGPVRLRLRQLSAISFLLSVIEKGKQYPFEFVRHNLTGYRAPGGPQNGDGALIATDDLQADLILLAEELSGQADLPVDGWAEPVHTVGDLAERFDVSTKTIFRWHQRGLVGWRFRFGDRRQRLAFPESCIRRFVARHTDLVNRGSSFSQLSRKERERIIARAHDLAIEGRTTVNAVAKVIAGETGRAVETIRLILKHYDEAHPKAGIFNRPAIQVPHDDQRLAVWEAHVDGASVATLARRFDRDEKWIYRTLTQMRARALQAQSIEYVHSPEFAERGADKAILQAPALDDPYAQEQKKRRVPGDLPPYLQQLFHLPLLTPEGERAMFRKFNYLKYKADRARQAYDPDKVSASTLDDVDDLLRQADRVKQQITQANLRLVVSIAKRHYSPKRDFFELVSDGNMSLMRAVERFDFTRGFKFSTYASWAIMKNFARTIPDQRQHLDRYQTGRDELLEYLSQASAEEFEDDHLPAVRRTVDRMLQTLGEREQSILRQRFGLDRANGEPRTLEQIGREFGVSKERIRQLESRAMTKLRDDFEDEFSTLLTA